MGLISRKQCGSLLMFLTDFILQVSYFFFCYQSPSSSLCTFFGSILSNIDDVLSINPSSNSNKQKVQHAANVNVLVAFIFFVCYQKTFETWKIKFFIKFWFQWYITTFIFWVMIFQGFSKEHWKVKDFD